MTIPEHIVEGVYDHLCRINGEWQPIGPNDIKEVLTAALPFLSVQGAVKKLEWNTPYQHDNTTFAETILGAWAVWDFGGKDSHVRGPTDVAGRYIGGDIEAAKAAAQADFEARIRSALEPCISETGIPATEPSTVRAQALEEAARNLINELSGNPGELIDKMAEAIRDWGSHYDDGPWETLPEDRKAGWRGDAERALAAVKEYLTTRVLSSPDHADAGKVEGDGWPTGEYEVDYEVICNGEWVAGSTDLNDAKHYAAVYSQDGKIEIVEARTYRRTLPSAPASEGAE